MTRADQMVDAVRRAEKAMQALATAVADYEAACGRDVEAIVGLPRLHGLLVQRLRGLGLGPVLAQAGTASRVSETWVMEFTATISALVRR